MGRAAVDESGTTRSFDFNVRAHQGGPALVSATARGEAVSGSTASATGSVRVEVERPDTIGRGGTKPIILAGLLGTSAMPAASISHW